MTSTPGTPSEQDLLYLPSLTVPDAQGYFDDWAARSAEARRTHPPTELAYGSGQHERIDVFTPGPPSGIRATVLFIHGGYWRAFHKDHFSYLAPPLLELGLRVCVMSYDLAPAVHVADIVQQTRAAVATVAKELTGPLVLAGHSAGAHLAAMVHSHDDDTSRAVLGSVGISGLYDLDAIRRTSLQPVLDITDDEVRTLSPVHLQPGVDAPFLVAVGGEESSAFHAESRALQSAWASVAPPVVVVPGRHHFTVCDELPSLLQQLLNHVEI